MSKLKAKVMKLDLNDLKDSDFEDVPDDVKEAVMEVIRDTASELPDEAQRVIEDVLGKRDGHTKFSELNEAHAEVLEYYTTKLPKVGELVERNEHGMSRYRMPRHDKNESAVVLEVFDSYRTDSEKEPVNGIIGVSDRKGIVRTYSVDLRRYKAVTMKGTN